MKPDRAETVPEPVVDKPSSPEPDTTELRPEAVETAESVPEPARASDPAGAFSDVKRNWQKVLKQLQISKHGSVAAALRAGSPVGVEGSVLKIGFGKGISGFHLERVQQDAGKISEAVKAVVGVDIKVTVVTLDGEDDESAGSVAAASAEAKATQHPLLDDVLVTFGGTVVDNDKDNPWED